VDGDEGETGGKSVVKTPLTRARGRDMNREDENVSSNKTSIWEATFESRGGVLSNDMSGWEYVYDRERGNVLYKRHARVGRCEPYRGKMCLQNHYLNGRKRARGKICSP
jgi:hypothetical protein